MFFFSLFWNSSSVLSPTTLCISYLNEMTQYRTVSFKVSNPLSFLLLMSKNIKRKWEKQKPWRFFFTNFNLSQMILNDYIIIFLFFLFQLFDCPRAINEPLKKRLTLTMLIITHYLVRHEGHREPRDEVGAQSQTEHINGI